MQIQVNGEAMVLGESTTISGLIRQMELEGKRLAVEVNEELVPRSQHTEFGLSDGDQVEVVHAIGGG